MYAHIGFRNGYQKVILFLLISIASSLLMGQSNTVTGNDITGIVTDYQGYWRSEVGAISGVKPTSAHDLLAFQADGIYYSTGVNDVELNSNGLIFTPLQFKAFSPLVANSSKGGQGAEDDGSLNSWTGQVHATPSEDIRPYLTDGVNGLGFSTFANNCGGTFIFSVLELDPASVGDGIPDILYFNNAVGASTNVEFIFKDGNGDQLGSSVLSVEGNGRSNIANVRNDRFNTASGTSAAVNVNQAIQGFHLELSDFQLTAQELTQISTMEVVLPSQADPPFVAYNGSALNACATGDDDGDGVCNLDDLCPGTTPGLEVDDTGCLVELDVTLSANAEACSYSIVPYHVQLINNSSTDVTGITVSDQLPTGFTFLDDSLSLSSGVVFSEISSPVEGQGNLIWSDFDIPAGDTVLISYSALVNPSITVGSYTNSVTITRANMAVSPLTATYQVSANQCSSAAFECEPAFFQVYMKRGGKNTYGKLNTNTGVYDFIAYLTPQANGLGFDPISNLAYGSNGDRFIALDKNGLITYLGVQFNNKVFSGDTDSLGNWYGKDGPDMVRVNLSGLGLTRWPGQGITGWDMAYNLDGNFYSVHKRTLYKFDTSTNTKSTVGTLTGEVVANSGHGAQWTGSDGHLYISNNSTGNIYRVNITTLDARQVMQSEGGLKFNDGFSCPSEIPAIYSNDFSDNSRYPSASQNAYAEDVGGNDIPSFGMIWAGDHVSAEDNSSANSSSTGDSRDDGLSYETVLVPGGTTTFTIDINTNMVGVDASYGLWIDWDDDGSFDNFFGGTESVSGATSVDITANVPQSFNGVTMNVRLRITEALIQNADVSGHIELPGEIEDYRYTATVQPEICENGIDDDGDGLADCSDPDCSSFNCGEICYNCIDDDGDGQIDENDDDCPPSAHTSCYTVNSLLDTGDDNPGDGVCADASGFCTLRAAVEEANAFSGYNCIEFSVAGTVNLGSTLVISDPVMINGTTAPGYVEGTPSFIASYSGIAMKIQETDDVMIRGLDLSGPAGSFTGTGIEAVLSSNVTFISNRIRFRKRGINVNESSDVTVKDNDLIDTGEECWDAAIYLNDITANYLAGGISVDGNAMGGSTLIPQTLLHISNADGIIISDGNTSGTNVSMNGPYKCWHPIRLVDVNNVQIYDVDLSYTETEMFGIGMWTMNCNNMNIDNITSKFRHRALFVDGGENHTVTNSDFRDSGLNADNGAVTFHNYAVNGPADAVLTGNQFGDVDLETKTLLTLRDCSDFVLSDGSVSGTNVELPAVMGQENPVRLFDTDYTLVAELDFSYNGANSTNTRGVWLQGGSTGTLVEDCTFKGRASAVHMESSQSTTLQCNTFTRNKHAMTSNGSSTTSSVANNDLKCNQLAIKNLTLNNIDANHNYWGDANGSSSYSGIGDYFYGQVDASQYLNQSSNCSPTISAGLCIQEICDNGIDDDHDGLIDCEDGGCLGEASCGGSGFVASPEEDYLTFTFDIDHEGWFSKNANGANIRLVSSSLSVAEVDSCDATFIPPSPTGTAFVMDADQDDFTTMMSSPRLNSLNLSGFQDGVLEWYWWTGNLNGVSYPTATELEVILVGHNEAEAVASVQIVHENEWRFLSLRLIDSLWTVDSGTLNEILASMDYIIIQVDAITAGAGIQCSQKEFFALDDIRFALDTDSDGVSDLRDECPFDPYKVEEGSCGCGMPDFDINGSPLCETAQVEASFDLIDYEISYHDKASGDKEKVTEVKSFFQEGNFSIYPNPSPGVVYIDIKEEACLIEIYDISGGLIKKNDLIYERGKHVLDLGYDAVGIYTAIIVCGERISHRHIIRK